MLTLMYITNRPEIAKIAENAGVDRIFVDLETIGKAERQGGMDTVQSHHTLDDIIKIRESISKAQLLVRSNPIHGNTPQEIETIIANGADLIMLPFFKSVNEVAKFIDCIHGRAKVILLVETAEAVLQMPMPCMFTEEELDQVIEDAEKEGCALQGEVKKLFMK